MFHISPEAAQTLVQVEFAVLDRLALAVPGAVVLLATLVAFAIGWLCLSASRTSRARNFGLFV